MYLVILSSEVTDDCLSHRLIYCAYCCSNRHWRFSVYSKAQKTIGLLVVEGPRDAVRHLKILLTYVRLYDG